MLYTQSSIQESDIKIFGNLTATHTLLISDIFGLFPNTYEAVIAYFKKDYCIVSYNDSGFDKTADDRKIRHTSINGYAEDMVRWLEKNQFKNVIYIAHSVNALLAFSSIAISPHLFFKFVLICATPYLLHDAQTHYTGSFEATEMDNLFYKLVHQTMDQQKPAVKKAVQFTDVLAAVFSEMNITDAQLIFDILFYKDCRHLLGQCKISTLILQVSNDKISPHDVGYFMQRSLPNSCLLRIKAKGQLPQLEAPEEIIQAMRFFFS